MALSPRLIVSQLNRDFGDIIRYIYFIKLCYINIECVSRYGLNSLIVNGMTGLNHNINLFTQMLWSRHVRVTSRVSIRHGMLADREHRRHVSCYGSSSSPLSLKLCRSSSYARWLRIGRVSRSRDTQPIFHEIPFAVWIH